MKYPQTLIYLVMPLALAAGGDAAWGSKTLPFETFVVESAQAPLERIHDGTVEAVHQAVLTECVHLERDHAPVRFGKGLGRQIELQLITRIRFHLVEQSVDSIVL